MSSDVLVPGQSFGGSEARAWRSIREHRQEVRKAANLLRARGIGVQIFEEQEPLHVRPRSALESLPDEILVSIMEYLDYGSLYRLSQTTGEFLRLSFDGIFEVDAEWRTFRYTIDRYFHEEDSRMTGLRSGPRMRVLDWARWSVRHPDIAQEEQSTGDVLEAGMAIEPSGQYEVAQESPMVADATHDSEGEDEDERETILEFMARLQ
ncbi:hypothetical protein ONZ43_g4748 [Nemania bipapillata]|uniref:Uncharacterized protein n=1 Tax=Nemania bipapillata TaxID=110536 RepID=A0ACC2IIU8_9PEZI|nr:hypothetical protein ONZ43_g4748 [Nemania bipapillata]